MDPYSTWTLPIRVSLLGPYVLGFPDKARLRYYDTDCSTLDFNKVCRLWVSVGVEVRWFATGISMWKRSLKYGYLSMFTLVYIRIRGPKGVNSVIKTSSRCNKVHSHQTRIKIGTTQ